MNTVIDPSFLSRVIGKTIKITTTTGCLQGVLINIEPSRTILINKVKDLGTGKNVPGAQLLFGRNILNVELQRAFPGTAEQESNGQTKEENIPLKEGLPDINNQHLETRESHSPSAQDIRTSVLQAIKHSVDEKEVEYTVIDQFQPVFGPAVRHLQYQKVISISAVGLNLCRHGKLCWLQVASKNRVYLFDVLVLGPKVFKNGLQTVLEDKSILKVIHDCRWLGDFLTHQYGVVLTNVFDTQVGDVYLFSMETGGFLPHRTSSFKECLVRHLNMPESQVSFLTHMDTLMREDLSVWFDRPMAPLLQKVLALEVLHLLPLRMAMLDAMLADFTLLVDGYLNSYRRGTADRLASPELTCVELPIELQQLKILQQARREKALKEYDINKGLLTRTASENMHQRTASSNASEPVQNPNHKQPTESSPNGRNTVDLTVTEHQETKTFLGRFPAVPCFPRFPFKSLDSTLPSASPIGQNLRMAGPKLFGK
ncbi:piRNA biogenesis protein EXD1 [Pelodytes ibericus]